MADNLEVRWRLRRESDLFSLRTHEQRLIQVWVHLQNRTAQAALTNPHDSLTALFDFKIAVK